MFSAILFVVSARAASTVSPCVMAPSDFVSNLEKSDGGARNALWQMIRDCPQKVNDLGNTSVDRLFIRGQLVDWRKDIVTMIKSDFKDRRLDGEEKDFEGLTKILGRLLRRALGLDNLPFISNIYIYYVLSSL